MCTQLLSYRKSWAGNLLMLFDLTLGLFFLQGLLRIAKLKSAYNSFIIGPRGSDVKPLIGNHGLGIF